MAFVHDLVGQAVDSVARARPFLCAPGEDSWSPILFMRLFSLSAEELALTTNVTVRELHEHPGSPVLQTHLGTIAAVFGGLLELNNDSTATARHMTDTPIRVFGNRTLIKAVTDGDVEKVRRYLQSISSGQAG